MGESYKDLIAWRKAMDLVTDIYRATREFPRDELYGLTNQLTKGRRFCAQQYRGRPGPLFPERVSPLP